MLDNKTKNNITQTTIKMVNFFLFNFFLGKSITDIKNSYKYIYTIFISVLQYFFKTYQIILKIFEQIRKAQKADKKNLLKKRTKKYKI